MGLYTLLLVGGVVSKEDGSALCLLKGFIAGARFLLVPPHSLAQ